MLVVPLGYLAFRSSTSGTWRAFVQDVGFGFGRLSPAEATARFGPHPYGMYAYNVAATVSNLLFSEPASGTFTIVEDITDRAVAPWEINYLVSSGALSALIAWWGIAAIRRDAGRSWSG